MRTCRFLWLLLFVMLLSACVSSRKTLTSTSHVASDSLMLSASDSVRQSSEQRDSANVIVADSSHVMTSAKEHGNDEETITEHISETTDAAGNKTTTTDRTIHRKGSYDRQAESQERTWHQEEQTNLWLSRLDSIAASRFGATLNHWTKDDSIAAAKDKNTKGVIADGQSWELMRNRLLLIVGLFVIALYAWHSQRNNNRHGQEKKE